MPAKTPYVTVKVFANAATSGAVHIRGLSHE